ncbi:MAG: endonuclease V [Proteobacteria bacterium]|nr:endonuclease V [Pseudomonadota bacterium]
MRQIPPQFSDLTSDQMRRMQVELAPRVEAVDRLGPIRTIVGLDVAYTDEVAIGAAVLLDAQTLELLDEATAVRAITAEYEPGLLSFRELPAVLDALAQLPTPDLVFCDGNGLAHPRRFGLACHLGVLTDLPTLGVAKSRYIGEHDEPDPGSGSWSEVVHEDEEVASALRTQSDVRWVYVSVGHRLSLPTARDWVLRCATEARIPQPTRYADQLANRLRREILDE